MREENARRRLDKRLDTRVRDGEGGTGNAKGFHKAVRRYGKALVDSALEDIAQDEAEAMEPCIMCGEPCVSLCCSNACHKEAVGIGIIPADK
jgi:hypothetical protein